MSLAAAFTLGVVLVTLLLLAMEWLAPDLVLMAALGVVTAGGVLSPEEALQGFADPTVLAIGSLFVVAAGLRSTGALRRAAAFLLGKTRGFKTVLLRLTSATAVSSGFLNNTPIVAMGIPAVLSWSREHDVAPSKLLIPLSYASILGGVCTLIGTSTNLVSDGLLRSSGYPGLGFFELARVGVPLLGLGIVYLVFVAPRFLPDRARMEALEGSGSLARNIHFHRVPEGSLAEGRTVREAGVTTPDLQLVRLVRASGRVQQVHPRTTLRRGDRLTFRGDPNEMAATAARLHLEPNDIVLGAHIDDLCELREVVIPEGSELTESKVSGINFPDRFGAVVLGVIRSGRRLDEVDDVVLRPGDSLFLATREGFIEAFEDSRDFYITGGSEVEPDDDEVPVWRPTKAKAGTVILAGIVGLATSGVVHISVAALLGAITTVALGLVSPAEARRSIDWSVLLVIGAAIGLGAALRESGAAAILAEWIVTAGEPLGPHGILAALLVASMLFTLVITNNAAVAILFPVAISVAGEQSLDPRPFVVAVTLAASLAFSTPVGYQTNLMVYGPGGYRFSDFVKAGAPLQLVTALVAAVLIPFIWSF